MYEWLYPFDHGDQINLTLTGKVVTWMLLCPLDHGDQASLTLTEEVIKCWFVTEMACL